MVQFTNLLPKDHEEEHLNSVKMPKSFSSDDELVNGSLKRKSDADAEGGIQSKKKKKKSKAERGLRLNGPKSHSKRRHSVSKPARDPRDEASPERPELEIETRSPSPVIDFDGLSRPSMYSHSIPMPIIDNG
jgi:GTP cyclohydrolase I